MKWGVRTFMYCLIALFILFILVIINLRKLGALW
jgi:hypothetical protein